MNAGKIGKFIAELRKSQSLTQQQLAEHIHIGREAVSKWERGLTIPDTASLMILSILFNVTVNELLAGERKSQENKEEIDNVALKVINASNKKIKRLKISFTAVILFLVILFFGYYFIYNYNSIKVYIATSEGENFAILDGLVVTSRQKSYLKLGTLLNYTDEEIDHIDLYYRRDEEYKKLLTTDDTNMLFVDFIGYNEIFKNVSIDRIFENLYLDIYTDDKVETLHLNIRMDFSNNYISAILTEKNKELSAEEAYEASLNEIPEFISENFTLEDGTYRYEFNIDEVEYIGIYDADIDEIRIFCNNGICTNLIMYSYIKNSLVTVDNNGNIIEYDFYAKECKQGTCETYKDLINYLSENLVKNLKN